MQGSSSPPALHVSGNGNTAVRRGLRLRRERTRVVLQRPLWLAENVQCKRDDVTRYAVTSAGARLIGNYLRVRRTE